MEVSELEGWVLLPAFITPLLRTDTAHKPWVVAQDAGGPLLKGGVEEAENCDSNNWSSAPGLVAVSPSPCTDCPQKGIDFCFTIYYLKNC